MFVILLLSENSGNLNEPFVNQNLERRGIDDCGSQRGGRVGESVNTVECTLPNHNLVRPQPL